MEPGAPSWIFDANAAAARALVAAVTAGDGDRLAAAWRELRLEENIDDFYRWAWPAPVLRCTAVLVASACHLRTVAAAAAVVFTAWLLPGAAAVGARRRGSC